MHSSSRRQRITISPCGRSGLFTGCTDPGITQKSVTRRKGTTVRLERLLDMGLDAEHADGLRGLHCNENIEVRLGVPTIAKATTRIAFTFSRPLVRQVHVRLGLIPGATLRCCQRRLSRTVFPGQAARLLHEDPWKGPLPQQGHGCTYPPHDKELIQPGAIRCCYRLGQYPNPRNNEFEGAINIPRAERRLALALRTLNPCPRQGRSGFGVLIVHLHYSNPQPLRPGPEPGLRIRDAHAGRRTERAILWPLQIHYCVRVVIIPRDSNDRELGGISFFVPVGIRTTISLRPLRLLSGIPSTVPGIALKSSSITLLAQPNGLHL